VAGWGAAWAGLIFSHWASGRLRATSFSRAVPVPGHVLGWRPMARPDHRAVPPVAR
jgi:hypothetical protein